MFDIAIIGAGPGGYVSAIKASKLGAKVVLIEKDNLGGTCLNRGCIPSKTFLNTVDKLNELKKFSKLGINIENTSFDFSKTSKRKDITVLKLRKGIENLLKANSITVLNGEAHLEEDNSLFVNKEKIEYKNLILASGSQPVEIKGLQRDGKFILNSDDILNLKELPKSVLIVGSGAIGIEWARIFSACNVETSVVEIASMLIPNADISLSDYIEKEFKNKKIKFFKDTKIEKIENNTVTLSCSEIVSPEIILVAAGRKPNLDFIKSALTTEYGFIKTDENFKTNFDNIYAIGDITGKLQLAHAASYQGISVVEHILNKKKVRIDYKLIPSIIYGKPEIASIGLKEQELSEDFKKSYFPLSLLGKAAADDESEGFIKVLSKDNKIVGAHIVSKEASSLIHNFSLPIKNQMSPQEFNELIFAHPTYAEGISEAVAALDNQAIHLIAGL